MKSRMCSSCGRAFSYEGMTPVFLDTDAYWSILETGRSEEEHAIKHFFKRWPRLYEWMVHTFAPVLFSGLTVKKYLARFPQGTGMKLINVGSGPQRLHPDVTNVDVFPFPNVDVIADGSALPFADDAFDVVCSEQVLEHVSDSSAMVRELVRIAKPGGSIFVAVPFMYPYHASPSDYTRWTVDGIRALFRGCTVKEYGLQIGPTSALLCTFAMWTAILFSFGIARLRHVLFYGLLVLLFPLKYLDLFVARIPGASTLALSVYCVIQKPAVESVNADAV